MQVLHLSRNSTVYMLWLGLGENKQNTVLDAKTTAETCPKVLLKKNIFVSAKKP